MRPHKGRGAVLCAVLLLACAPLAAQQYTISTIAAGLNNPTSVAVDRAGNVYFSDWSGLIRKVWARDGAISVVVGIGVTGYKRRRRAGDRRRDRQGD